jgi:hypothetical protein
LFYHLINFFRTPFMNHMNHKVPVVKYSWRHVSVPVYRRTYLWFRASYAPEACGIWKKGHPGCRVRKFSILPTQKNSFLASI